MSQHNHLESYKNINIKNYLDATVQNCEIAYLKNELHKHEKIEDEINEKLFKTFLLNIDNLINILKKSHEINNRVYEIKSMINEYKKIFRYFDTDTCTNHEDTKSFEELIAQFDKEAQIFVTKKRVLLYSDIFYMQDNQERKEHVLVFTNDLLIIGSKIQNDKETKKDETLYALKNAFNYNVMEVTAKDEQLIIKIDPISYIFESSKKAVNLACKTYNENKYKYKKESMKKISHDDMIQEETKHEMIDYYIKTEQYECLQQYKGKVDFEFSFSDVRYNKDVLFILLDLLDDKKRKTFFCNYLDHLFDKKIEKINIIQDLDSYIKSIYNVFRMHYKVCKELFAEYDSRFSVDEIENVGFIVYIESVIIKVFELMRKRIFGKKCNVKETEEYLQNLDLCLKIDGYNFTYLFEFFDEEKSKKNYETIKHDKQTIDGIIDEMIGKEE
ncbi:hypothetical protein BDAP_000645 [Binucleata daphniae]